MSQLFCSGMNEYHALGIPTSENQTSFIEHPSFEFAPLLIGCGENHSLFFTKERELKSCGQNKNNECGVGSFSEVHTPTNIDDCELTGKLVTHISAGYHHSVVCVDNREIYVCGKNKDHQIGAGPERSLFTKSKIPIEPWERITHLVCGSRFTFFVIDNTKIFVTGTSTYGALLLPLTTTAINWTLVQADILGNKQVKFIGCGSNHTCVVTQGESDQIFAAGYNTEGECGLPLKNGYKDVTEVEHSCLAGRVISQIAFGYYHTIILTSFNEIFTYGYNYYGQLGTDNITNNHVPQLLRIEGVGPWNSIKVFAGGHHSIVVVDGIDVYMCGSKTYGQLGSGPHSETGGVSQLTMSKVEIKPKYPIHDIICGMYQTFIRCGIFGDDHKTSRFRESIYRCSKFVDLIIN